MAERDANHAPLRLSVLDRLIDEEPKLRSEIPMAHAASLTRLKAAVRRDLETLLNTRRTSDILPDGCVQVLSSVYVYGLPDISSLPANFLYEQTRLLQAIESAVATFEKRLEGVRVAVVPATGLSRVLRFSIEGLLRIDPLPEHVVYDGSLELTSLEVQVSGGDRAG